MMTTTAATFTPLPFELFVVVVVFGVLGATTCVALVPAADVAAGIVAVIATVAVTLGVAVAVAVLVTVAVAVLVAVAVTVCAEAVPDAASTIDSTVVTATKYQSMRVTMVLFLASVCDT